MEPLPPSFKALYRLALRATSVSVLHKTSARKNIIKLWRPTFDKVAQFIRVLESRQPSSAVCQRRKGLLDTWQGRMDNTLTFLLSSAQSRSLPHKVVKNISILSGRHRFWVRESYYKGIKQWNPQRPPTAPEYDPKSLLPKDRRATNLRAKTREGKKVNEQCWNALGEVVRMAEARHDLSLGRHRVKAWVPER
ncbi:hypothetical protein EDD16DRAFT_1605628 [Pisolithus croceorrhizus]|nr:hypothetical protein EDD16DRAFT_1605628 [Pisolithus croceorrhizus]KAI6125526.1 hypothetical protein EV401DRAFT_1938224 [Pisolithus croceorrhizus]